jgi:hypothetical protein
MWLWEFVAAFLKNGEAEPCYKFEVYWTLQGRKKNDFDVVNKCVWNHWNN